MGGWVGGWIGGWAVHQKQAATSSSSFSTMERRARAELSAAVGQKAVLSTNLLLGKERGG